MNRLQEIEARKSEIKASLGTLEDVEEVRKLNEEVDALNIEEKELREVEERKNVAKKLEEGSLEAKKIEVKEERKMEEKKFDLSSPEYRSAWAKKLMGLSDERFTEDEKRALGDAITTTATDFVASAENTQGINNGGLFIPTSVRSDLMELISKQSPIFNDVRKLQVAGNIDLPYLFSSDDAEWYVELDDTKNGSAEFRNMQLTGWELAKDIVITWKLEEMAVDSFIAFILDELANKMGKALVNAVIYGDGENKPTGITTGLSAITTGDNAIERVLNTYRGLSEDARIGAKVYISTETNLDIVSYKDNNGNYPFLAGIPSVSGFSIAVDPYLKGDDIVSGNMRNYILNEVVAPRVEKERTVKGRKTTYGGYAIYDGKARPDYFTLGRKATAAQAKATSK
ncbi:MAG: phage major capsid protein [Ruminococcus sp.]|nr:phage major capsid protein [Ruminococcus sp.]